MSNWSWLPISALALVSTLAAGAASCAPPQHVELAFDLARKGITLAEVSYLLEHDGRTYRITETTRGRGVLALRGTIRRTSRGNVSPQGLRPVQFTDERTGRDTARVDFDWKQKTVTQQYKGEPRVEPLPPHAQDRLAFVFDLSFAPHRAEAVFDLFDGRGQSHHVYTAAGRERVKTPLGEFDALRFMRGNAEERSEVWLAAELGFLPVKLVNLEKDGTRYEQVATKINLTP